ncbi:MAG: hypothetical protein ACT6RN_01985 [Agrobacterium sp.]|nr:MULTISPECIES: hypothetical protein [Agrobacterium tumefaciens complex]MCA2372079.1 hypothetical protein [Agrobacterium tomkonis CIP 111-78]
MPIAENFDDLLAKFSDWYEELAKLKVFASKRPIGADATSLKGNSIS